MFEDELRRDTCKAQGSSGRSPCTDSPFEKIALCVDLDHIMSDRGELPGLDSCGDCAGSLRLYLRALETLI